MTVPAPLVMTTLLAFVCALTRMPPPVPLPEITLRSAAVVPPMTLFGDWTSIPRKLAGVCAASPATVVPM
jgi:hypothetical protein